jgi:hypothetical protein
MIFSLFYVNPNNNNKNGYSENQSPAKSAAHSPSIPFKSVHHHMLPARQQPDFNFALE